MSRLASAIAELRENERQWEAFTTIGDCAVLAPPGSGKTKLLTTRLAYDLVSEAIPPPQGAACITMTNEAAGELRRRFAALGVLARPNVTVGTVHAFALSSIVGPYARATGRPELADARLASNGEKDAAFQRAFAAVLDAGDNRITAHATMEKVRRLADYSGDNLLGGPDIARLARRYESELQKVGTYDFNDLMRHAVEMVQEHEWLRRMLIATYPHLYVDEYQDLPPTLDALVRALAFDQTVDATLFAVGDPDQAINGFMGTRPELLVELAALPGVTRVDLELNYRCGQDIVQASLRALGQERNVRGVNDGGDIVIEAAADGPDAQRERAVALVRDALDEGVPYEQITVLAQATEERDLIVDALRANEIPVFARSDRDYGATPVTMAIETLALYAATDPPPAEDLADLLDTWQTVLLESIDHSAITAIVDLITTTSADSAAGEFVQALTKLGLQELVEDPGSSQDGRQLERMRVALAPGGELGALTVKDLADRARAKGRVMAATIHGIKGLEFDVVIVCDCEEGRMPHWGSIKGADPKTAIAGDNRKFYVSLTRARHRVHLVWSDWRISKRGNRYEIQLSRFAQALSRPVEK
jgi:DNA helicase II / ATP-dependent DNA helicase PcrA